MHPKWFECRACANEIRSVHRPAFCLGCGEEGSLFRQDGYDDREPGEDDGTGDYDRAIEAREERLREL